MLWILWKQEGWNKTAITTVDVLCEVPCSRNQNIGLGTEAIFFCKYIFAETMI